MSDTLPPMTPALGANIGNPSSPIRTGGSHVTNVPEFDKEDFSSWKDRFLIYLDGLEPYILEILENRPFVPLSPLSTSTNPLPKPQNQWPHDDRRLVNQDKRLKSILISCLPNDVMKSVIKCTTTKAIWTDLILTHEGPSKIKDTKIAALRLKFNSFKALEGEKVNGTFTRLKKSNRFTIQASNSKALICNPSMPDNDFDIEEDQRSSSEFLADLNVEFHERALFENQRRLYKRFGRVGYPKKPIDRSNETRFACGKLGH
ncbi:hypothetical protein Tco_0964344 [Tanacetum coccineum]